MKALVKSAPGSGHFGLKEIPEPEPETGEVLLKIGAAGICGSDIHILKGEYPCRPPVVLGHEFTGTIVELGPGVSNWNLGDRVVSMPYGVVCGRCEFCVSGDYGLCSSRRSYGSGMNGGFAEYISVNAARIFSIPQNLEFSAAALIEPLACSTKAVFDIAKARPGAVALILGPGPVGLLTLQAAKAAGCCCVLVGLQRDASRLNLAMELGAEQIFYSDLPETEILLNEYLGEDGASLVFECSGAGKALDFGLQFCGKHGHIIQVGLFGKAVDINPDPIVMKELMIQGSFASSFKSWQKAIDLVFSNQAKLDVLVSDVYSFSEWEEAFTIAKRGDRLKVVLSPDGSLN
jgi:L-iditol 2-dehydrogenase